MRKFIVATFAAVVLLCVGISPASATSLPDTWTSADSAHHSDGGYVTCQVKWHGHPSGLDSWTPIAVAIVLHNPGVFVTSWSVAHYADPDYTRYGVWGDFTSVTSAYVTSDNDYDDVTSSYATFHFVTSSGDYPCGARPPNLLP